MEISNRIIVPEYAWTTSYFHRGCKHYAWKICSDEKNMKVMLDKKFVCGFCEKHNRLNFYFDLRPISIYVR